MCLRMKVKESHLNLWRMFDSDLRGGVWQSRNYKRRTSRRIQSFRIQLTKGRLMKVRINYLFFDSSLPNKCHEFILIKPCAHILTLWSQQLVWGRCKKHQVHGGLDLPCGHWRAVLLASFGPVPRTSSQDYSSYFHCGRRLQLEFPAIFFPKSMKPYIILY